MVRENGNGLLSMINYLGARGLLKLFRHQMMINDGGDLIIKILSFHEIKHMLQS